MYKVEKSVTLEAEYPDSYSGDVSLSCNDGDYALDGMWRVDHVDQWNGEDDDDSTAVYHDERDVVFYTSTSSAAKDKWLFRFENLADGRAQVKLFVTCIEKQTEQADGHKHSVVLSDLNLTADSYGSDENSTASTVCGGDELAVAPSFDFTQRTVNWIFRNYPTADGRGWNWSFVVESGHAPASVPVKVGFRCLKTKVANAGSKSHSHQLIRSWRPQTTPFTDFYLGLGTQEKQHSCDAGADGSKFQDYKAMVGGFYIFDPHHTWYLGMDPRPKTRAYRLFNDGVAGPDLNRVDLGALCVKSRTGKQIKP
jgi:hypothetical protein